MKQHPRRKDDANPPLLYQPWDQQPKESNQAFAGFRCYVEMGDERSLRAVAQKLAKSVSLIRRWSGRWNWVERTKKYIRFLIESADQQAQEAVLERRLPDIMCEAETLARVSMLARADPLMLLDDDGELDIKKLKELDLGYLLAGIETITTTHSNGTVTVRKRIKIESRAKFLELLGKHHGSWTGEITDPDEVLSRFLNISKDQLPSHAR